MTKRIVYVQYTNPAGYPPLEHSSLILARRGWQVLFLGIESFGTKGFVLPEHVNIQVRLLGAVPPGWRQKLHYAWFCIWAIATAILWRPAWIYASDLMACPVGLAGHWLGFGTIYHEHDSPGEESLRAGFGRFLSSMRAAFSRSAHLSVLPNEERLRVFREALQPRETVLVWNCPRRDEVAVNRPGADVKLLYHGSINPARLPITLIDALALLPETVSLRIVGYETIGSQGYVDQLKARSVSQGLTSNRLDFRGAIPRSRLMECCAEAQIGIGFLPRQSNDINMTAMFGASNKVFDYMACGLALIVSNQADWAGPLVASGTAAACDPHDPESIAAAVRSLLQGPGELSRRGERGRQLILDRWNYETQFQPVLDRLEQPR